MGQLQSVIGALGAHARNVGVAHTNLPPPIGKPIGTPLEEIRGELFELGEQLGPLLSGSAQTFVQDSRCLLQTMVCRIAVVGQVKAGKSSFINGLIRQPELLPTNVNPWTTAVTRLHFARHDAPRDVAAEFRFFDPDEWQRLADGGGRLRELTERLVPGFEAELLTQQLATMRDRAAARLGSEFARLLGTSHRFPTVDRVTLEAYVCSGNRTAPPKTVPAPGCYADIIKSADLYLGSGPFAFPSTVIDTPGTNDPYLVRDEITRQSLDTADLYIVVLTARQALSAADVALMRILRGLHKDRIIVFVNRIDELDDLESDLQAVRTHVEKGLRREFPGVEIPVHYGSVRWANVALANETAQSPAALRKYATQVATSHGKPLATGENARELLFMCSGMPQLAHTLDRCILQSEPARMIRHIATRFAELSRLGVTATRDELRQARPAIETGLHSVSTKDGLTTELEKLQALARRIEQSAVEFEMALKSTVEGELHALEVALSDAVERYAQDECLRLAEAIREGSRHRVWRCETAQLRQRLEDEFWLQFRSIAKRVLAGEAKILPSLQQLVARFFPGDAGAQGLDLRPTPMRSPSISALGKAVALDLDEPRWKGWWTRKRTSAERTDELAQLIRAEFLPIADDLAQAAREELLGQIAATVQQSSAVCLHVVEQLRARCKSQGARISEQVRSSEDTTSTTRCTERSQELQDRLTAWESINSRLCAQPE